MHEEGQGSCETKLFCKMKTVTIFFRNYMEYKIWQKDGENLLTIHDGAASHIYKKSAKYVTNALEEVCALRALIVLHGCIEIMRDLLTQVMKLYTLSTTGLFSSTFLNLRLTSNTPRLPHYHHLFHSLCHLLHLPSISNLLLFFYILLFGPCLALPVSLWVGFSVGTG